jgi:hypothetical protein
VLIAGNRASVFGWKGNRTQFSSCPTTAVPKEKFVKVEFLFDFSTCGHFRWPIDLTSTPPMT